MRDCSRRVTPPFKGRGWGRGLASAQATTKLCSKMISPTSISLFPMNSRASGSTARSPAVTGLSRTRIQEAIKGGAAQVDGKPARASQVLEAGQRVTMAGEAAMAASATAGEAPAADDIPLRILYEDDYLLVVDKPAGMVTHPAPGHSSGTLVNALLAHAPALAGVGDRARPGIVHRLDKDTSGLLVVAKDPATHAALAQQMKDRAMVKRYLALVEGAMPTAEGVIDAPIGRDPRQRLRMGLLSVASGGREARTRFRMLEEHGGRSLLEVQLETGRTHQIRVHWPPCIIPSSVIPSMVAPSARCHRASSCTPPISNFAIPRPASG